MSTHIVEVVPVALEPHPNADSLSLVRVFGYTAIVRTDDWRGRDRAAYLPVDSVVPESPDFAFLGGHRRIKAKKLRGIYSEGLLVPAPDGAQVGDDVTAALGVEFYDPDKFKDVRLSTGGECAPDPPGPIIPRYTEIENIKRYHSIFEPGEEVIATEKIHGANFRATLRQDEGGGYRLHVGSHRRWIRDTDKETSWWKCARDAQLAERLAGWSDGVIYGEMFGSVQDLKYGAAPGQLMFRAFDALSPMGLYLDHDLLAETLLELGIDMVPIVYRGPFNIEKLKEIAEEPSVIGGGIREGLVIRPVRERYDHRVGRVILKLISERYRLRKDA